MVLCISCMHVYALTNTHIKVRTNTIHLILTKNSLPWQVKATLEQATTGPLVHIRASDCLYTRAWTNIMGLQGQTSISIYVCFGGNLVLTKRPMHDCFAIRFNVDQKNELQLQMLALPLVDAKKRDLHTFMYLIN